MEWKSFEREIPKKNGDYLLAQNGIPKDVKYLYCEDDCDDVWEQIPYGKYSHWMYLEKINNS